MDVFLVALMYYGLGAFIVGLAIGGLLRRTRQPWRWMTAVAVAAVPAWVGFWIWIGSRPCGPDCVTDVTVPLASLPIQLAAYGAGAATVLRLSGR
jgi:hypothetical protein